MGHGNLSGREGSGSDSASLAWPGEGLSVVGAVFLRGLFRFLSGLGPYYIRQLAEFAPLVPSVK